jgi:hypothetical protein
MGPSYWVRPDPGRPLLGAGVALRAGCLGLQRGGGQSEGTRRSLTTTRGAVVRAGCRGAGRRHLNLSQRGVDRNSPSGAEGQTGLGGSRRTLRQQCSSCNGAHTREWESEEVEPYDSMKRYWAIP